MTPIDTIMQAFAAGGSAAYFGEEVSQLEHALQTAHLAENLGADNDLVVAALLHDLGHLLSGLPESAAEDGVDDRHEEAAAAWLERYFPPTVTMPVRMHVVAKRYLCAVDPVYRAQLSPASERSLQLQGGPFDASAAKEFEQHAFAQQAVALRRWDDAAKIVGRAVPDLEHYRPHLQRALARGPGEKRNGNQI
jgi:gamma-butyrobetaine dioxygenase